MHDRFEQTYIHDITNKLSLLCAEPDKSGTVASNNRQKQLRNIVIFYLYRAFSFQKTASEAKLMSGGLLSGVSALVTGR